MQDQHDGNLSRKHNLDEHLLGDTKSGNTRVHWKPMCKVSTHWLYDGYRWGSVSCEKHFDFTVKRWGNFLQGEDLKSEFKFLCESVLKAETPLIYKRAAERMDKFIAVHSHLQLWWDGGRSVSPMFSLPSNLFTMFQRQTMQKRAFTMG